MWLSWPSGITPRTSARSPDTLATIDVRGATVVTTASRWPGAGAGRAAPAVAAAGGQLKGPVAAWLEAADGDAAGPPQATPASAARATTAAATRVRRHIAELDAIASSSHL